MAAMTDYLRNKLMNHVTKNIAYTPPSSLWLALFTTPADASGGGTEVTGGGYARRPIPFTTPMGGSGYNSADVFFPTATAPWNSIVSIAIFDANMAGNMLFYGKVTVPEFVNTGNTYVVEQNDILLTMN